MSTQEHLDALVWAATATTPMDRDEAKEILDHASKLVASGESSVPAALVERIDALSERAIAAAGGDTKASSTLRALLADLLMGDDEDESTAPLDDDLLGDPSDDLMALFLAEGADSLAEIESSILALEDPASAEDAEHALASLKRDIHTAKGECGVLGLHTAQDLWHQVESFIEDHDGGRATDTLVEALDWHRAYFALLAADPSSKAPAREALLRKLTRPQPTSADAVAEAPEEAEDEGEAVTFSQELLDDDTLPEFITEARQHLEDSEGALLELETDTTSQDGIDRVFRAYHTIKGVAGFLNIDPVTDLAHVVETLLDRFRTSDIEFTSGHADVVLESKDMMERLFDALLGGEGPSASGLAKLIAYVGKVAENPKDLPPVDIRAVKNVLASAGLTDDADLEAITKDPNRATARLGAILIERGSLTEAQLKQALKHQVDLEANGESLRLGEVLVNIGAVTESQLDLALEVQGGRSSLGRLLETKVSTPTTPPPTEPKKRAKVESTIRVSTQRLDSLVDMVGELVIAQQMVVQGTEEVEASTDDDNLTRNLSHLGKITRDLQEASMSLRMVTFQSTFQKMHRLVRDVASRAGKQIKLEIVGADTEVDRNVVDKISDPLVHLVRNAIDHGVEAPDEREAAGKSPQGVVKLEARHQGGAIVISLKDDGRGLAREKIIAKAVEKGLIPADRDTSEMTDSMVFNLVFEPGFSTAAAVTDISGRGVGMDVVKRNIETMRGKVEIFSKPGEGAEFQIQLPLTLAIIDAMIVRSGVERYVIPTLAIVQSFRPSDQQLHAIRGDNPMVEVRGQLVPLHRLDKVLDGYGGASESPKTTLILVEGMGRRVCLAVDEIIGQQQVVIKKLGACMPSARVISGGAILGDGRVALIVDIEGILAESESVALCEA